MPLRPATAARSHSRATAWCAFMSTLLVAVACLICAPGAWAQASAQSRPVPAQTTTDAIPWASLTPGQKNALKPLQAEWSRIDGASQSKWVEIANRLPTMPPAERARVQNRMTEWTKLTPRERGQARMNFREAQQVPAQERKAKWEEYKALPPEQRKQLAARATPAPRKAHANGGAPDAAPKSSVVPNPSYAPRPKPVAPTVAQAQPGATTNLITKRPSPPVHQPSGLPKIAVTPGFVDQSTLLPKRGPQGAAPRSAAAAASAPRRP